MSSPATIRSDASWQSMNLRWDNLYSEVELYKAAVRLYTNPLFNWRKALSTSTDGQTLYDFARRGHRNLEELHRRLQCRQFHFRPGLALHFNFNGRSRTLYIYPWEERLVDLLLYRLLSRRFHNCFSPHSYAYRYRGFGVDRCQRKIAALLRAAPPPVYIMKRDIADYFPSVDHEILEGQLKNACAPDDYLLELLEERIRFSYLENGVPSTASRGIPFGTAIACFFANVYLTDLDKRMSRVPRLCYFRYADDLLAFSPDRDALLEARTTFQREIGALNLKSKPSHELDLSLCQKSVEDPLFHGATHFRHLGLEYRSNGVTALSRDKFRKICNLFRFQFRRHRAKLARMIDPGKKARHAIELARKALDASPRNVAIIDYYLKHVEDEAQLRLLDRWLAEEVLSIAFGGGHRKSYFRLMPYDRLREMGLPSLVHRRRLIRHGHIESPFFVWKQTQAEKSSRRPAARPHRSDSHAANAVFSPVPEAAATQSS